MITLLSGRSKARMIAPAIIAMPAIIRKNMDLSMPLQKLPSQPAMKLPVKLVATLPYAGAYRVPLYPVTPVIFAATCLYMLYSSVTYALGQDAQTATLLTYVVTGLGLGLGVVLL